MKTYIKAYIAGFVDGDGSICITKSGKNKNRPNRLLPAVCIANRNMDVINWIPKQFAGMKIYKDTHFDERSPKYSASHRLFLFGYDSVLNFLSEISPYLIVKRKQAELVIKFIKRRKVKIKKEYHAPYDKEDYKIRKLVMELNKIAK